MEDNLETTMIKLNIPNVSVIILLYLETIIIKHFTLHTRKKIILRRLKKYVIAIIVVLLFSRTFAKECRKKYRRKSKLNTIT